MFLCNTLSVWEDQDEVAVVLVEVAEERVDKVRKIVTLTQRKRMPLIRNTFHID